MLNRLKDFILTALNYFTNIDYATLSKNKKYIKVY